MNDAPTGFNRTLINANMQIRSACTTCKTVIIGSVLNGLIDLETDHRCNCESQEASSFGAHGT
jgi:hypothetical protein